MKRNTPVGVKMKIWIMVGIGFLVKRSITNDPVLLQNLVCFVEIDEQQQQNEQHGFIPVQITIVE